MVINLCGSGDPSSKEREEIAMTYEQKKLLRRAAQMAVDDYKHFDMGFWRIKVTKRIKAQWAKVYPSRKDSSRKNLDCGTVCCLAGNVCAAKLGVKAFNVMYSDAIAETAAALVGLTDTEVEEIFTPEGACYDDVPKNKKGTRAYAKAIQAGVEKFIMKKEGLPEFYKEQLLKKAFESETTLAQPDSTGVPV